MVSVKNSRTLCLLTFRFLKINRGRSFAAVLAVTLTSLLFTASFTDIGSLFLSKLETNKKTYFTASHATVQSLSDEEAGRTLTALKTCKSVERYGASQFLGTASDSRFPYLVEIHCGDKNSAENRLSLPTEGHMPTEKDEIAISTAVLDALGLSRTLGEEIVLPISIDGGPDKDTSFTLCGFWEGEQVSRWQYAWVSAEYAREVLPQNKAAARDPFTGTWTYSVWFHNLWNLNGKIKALNTLSGLTDSGRTGVGFELSPAYEIALSREGGLSVSFILGLLFLILLAGYLIIYNIFQISVKNDIRCYGLLKNIGATGRQLKKSSAYKPFFYPPSGSLSVSYRDILPALFWFPY